MSASPAVESPRDLTLPGPDSQSARQVLSAYLRVQYRSLLTLPLAQLLGDPAGAKRFTSHVRDVAKQDPGAVFSILRKPHIGGLIRLVAIRDGSGLEMREWAIELIAYFEFELAVRGLADAKVHLAGPIERLISLQRRVSVALPTDARRIDFSGSSVTVTARGDTFTLDMEGDSDRFESPFHEIVDPMVLATVDSNPRAGMEAHPDKEGNHVDLGIKSADEWVDSLRSAHALVAEFAPTLIPEMELFVHQIVPVGFEQEKHLSASLKEVVGNIYMSLHPDPLIMAEALIHEFSHNKIHALWTLSPLLENAFEPLYASPVRPDPRPLFGVMLAAHAFLPVEHMYEQMTASEHPMVKHPRFAQRRAQVRKMNDEATRTVVDNGVPTPAGVNVLAEMRALNDRFASA